MGEPFGPVIAENDRVEGPLDLVFRDGFISAPTLVIGETLSSRCRNQPIAFDRGSSAHRTGVKTVAAEHDPVAGVGDDDRLPIRRTVDEVTTVPPRLQGTRVMTKLQLLETVNDWLPREYVQRQLETPSMRSRFTTVASMVDSWLTPNCRLQS